MKHNKPFSYFKNISILFILSLALSSCTEDFDYQAENSLESDVWTYNEEISFELVAPDTTTWYNLELEVRHDPDFGYQNLYIEIETGFPSDTSFTDIINLDLAKTTGQWLGKCNSKKCSIPFLLKNRFRFEETGKYSFLFRQASRLDSLEGIQSFQLSLRKALDES
jgi:gliding motility-associated lipoprotein GldH